MQLMNAQLLNCIVEPIFHFILVHICRTLPRGVKAEFAVTQWGTFQATEKFCIYILWYMFMHPGTCFMQGVSVVMLEVFI